MRAGWSGWRKNHWCDVATAVSARMKGEVDKVLVRVSVSVSDLVRLRGGGTEEKTGAAKMEVAKINMPRFSLGVTRMALGMSTSEGQVHLRHLEIKPDSLDTSRGQMVNILVKGC